MRVEYHPLAFEELEEAAVYLEDQALGLGLEFEDEYQATLNKIVDNPLTYRKIYKDVRKLNLKRFQYGILYIVEENRLIILAVMHLKRKPFYWKQRIK